MSTHLDDRLPVTPPDALATLWSVVAHPAWSAVEEPEEPWTALLPTDTRPALAFGEVDPLTRFHAVLHIYRQLDDKEATTRERAEGALMAILQEHHPVLDKLPIGPAAALREAMRTCQLNPSGDWPLAAYRLVGRNDLAEGLSSSPEPLSSSGYRSVKDYIVSAFGTVSDPLRRSQCNIDSTSRCAVSDIRILLPDQVCSRKAARRRQLYGAVA